MLFNSYIFILCFLPITLIGYFALQHFGRDQAAKVYLLIMSLWFYGYFNYYYLAIICSSIAVNYILSRCMIRSEKGGAGGKNKFLILGIIFNVGLIFYFKYFDFFLWNMNLVFGTDFVLKNIVLPLGISFFTFQQISFIADTCKGETKDYSFLEYALFVAFFPQLVAGPIVMHSELIPQFRDKNKRKADFDNISRGIMMFSRGLAKKVLIADTFAKAVDWGFDKAAIFSTGEDALAFYEVLIVMLSYTFQIYFDFSGYSDMATGLGAMFNFDIPMNFNSPYKALSVADFWKRWHMTLTRFLTRYIYIPLGGNRKGRARTYLNIMIVFLISGIWHGANWTFILWGVIHGLGQCFNRAFGGLYAKMVNCLQKGSIGRIMLYPLKAVQWLITFAFVNITCLLFRADSVKEWTDILKRLSVPYYNIRKELLEAFRIPKLNQLLGLFGASIDDNAVLYIGMYAMMAFALIICLFFKNNYERRYEKNALSLIFTWALLFICVLSLSSVSVFLYFNF